MASAPATSPDGSGSDHGATGGVTGEAAFTARLGRRATPVVRTPLAVSTRRGPGRLAGTFGAFSNRLGLSQTSRWTLDATADTSTDERDHVRPPINYWPWDADAPVDDRGDAAATSSPPPGLRAPVATHDNDADDFVPSGDDRLDALRRLLTKPKSKQPSARKPAGSASRGADTAGGPRPVATPARPVRRGLPQVLHRRGSAVRRPQPGDIARRLRPAAVDPRSVAARPASGAVPANLPAAAAQARAADAVERSATGPARQDVRPSPRPADPTPAQPPRATGTRPPWADDHRRAPAGDAGQQAVAARQPVDLAAAARRRPADPVDTRVPGATAARPGFTPDAQPRPVPDGGGGRSRPAADRADGPSRPAADRAAPTAPRPPAAPQAAVSEPRDPEPIRRAGTEPTAGTHAMPTPAAPAARTDTTAGDALRRATDSPSSAPGAAPPLQGAAPTPRVPQAASAPSPIHPSGSVLPDGPTAPTARPGTVGPAAPPAAERSAGPDVAARAARLPAGGVEATPSPAPPLSATAASPRAPGDRPRPSDDGARSPVGSEPRGGALAPGPAGRQVPAGTPHDLAAGTPRPPLTADVPAGPTIARATPPASPTAPAIASATTPADTGVRRAPEARGTPAPTGRAADEPAMRRAAHAEPDRSLPVAGALPPSSRRTATPGDRASADHGTDAAGSPWPLRRQVATTAADVELAARTRRPVAPSAASPPGDAPTATDARGVDDDARPAPPLTPRLRAVDDDERRAPTAAGHADVSAAPRYRPTWQADSAEPTTRRPNAGDEPLRRAADRSSGHVDGAPTARSEATTAGPAPASTAPGAPPALVRRAPVDAAAVRPAPAPSSLTPLAHTGTTSPGGLPPSPTSPASPTSRTSPTEPAAPSLARTADGPNGRVAPATHATPAAATPDATRSPGTDDRARAAAPDAAAGTAAAPGAVRGAPAPAAVDGRRADVATTDSPAAPRPAPPAVRRTDVPTRGGADRPLDAEADGAGTASGAHPDAPVRRFESVLRRAPAAPAPLPVQWRPLASAIAGERRVRLSTNAASRAALRAAGKRAATTGDVIHLAAPLRGPADAPVLAHELTHVASPSPAPRFFDDDRDSPEERRAEMIADVIRRSPVLPRAAAAAVTPDLPVGRRPASSRRSAETLRRSPADQPAVHATPSVTADDLVRRLSGGAAAPEAAGTIRRTMHGSSRPARPSGPGRAPTAPPATTGTIRRSLDTTRSAPAAAAGTAPAETVRRLLSTDGSSSGPTTSTSTGQDGERTTESPELRTRGWPMMTNGIDSSTLRDLADWVVEQVEERVIRELERRGGRYRGEF